MSYSHSRQSFNWLRNVGLLATIIISLTLLFNSCKKDDPQPNSPGGGGGGNSGFNITIGGSILDVDGNFVQGATVEFDGQSATTDMRGVFRLNDVTASRGVNYVKVSKPGYFSTGRNIHVHNSETVNIRVRLEPRVLTGSFSGATGGTVSTMTGMSAEIPAGAFEGNYQGMVSAYTRYFDPSDQRTAELIPGMEADNGDGEMGLLVSFGMGQFEFEDENGNILDLAEGQSANLTMPVPPSLVGDANPSIPLWYFDETAGLWKEEGSATLNGSNYEGSVNHFSWWNCDDVRTCIYTLKINISCGGAPFPGLPIHVQVSNGLSGTGVTGADGSISSVFPCFSEVTVSIIPNGASEFEEIGVVFTGDQPEGDESFVTVENLEALCGPHATVSGTVLKSDLSPVSNGYAYLRYDDEYTEPVFFDDLGAFFAGYYSFDEAFWDEEAEIVVWDLDNFTTAIGPNVPFNEQVNVLDAPIIIGGGSASVNGRIYMAGTAEDAMYCLDASNGELIWSRDEGQMEREVSPVIYDGRVYIRTLSGQFFCFNGFDGSEIWSSFNSDGNSPISDGLGTIYTTAQSGLIKAWDFNDGSTVWTANIGGTTSDACRLNDMIYMGQDLANDTSFVVMDRLTGDYVWTFNSGSDVNSSPCVANGKVFFMDDSHELYALDALSGDLAWQASIGSGPYIWGSPTTGGGLVFTQAVNNVRAFDQNTGAVQWDYSITSSSGGEEPYYWNNKLYVSGSNSGNFVCLNATTGEELWTLEPTGLGQTANYMLVVDGVLFMHRYEEPYELQARNANTGALLWTTSLNENMDAPMVVVDEFGQAHYCTLSGMQQ